MDFDLFLANFQYLLLAVLLLPLAAAGVILALGRTGTPTVRRVAAYAAAIHLILTAGLTFLVGSALSERVRWGSAGYTGRYEPLAVVGAPSTEGPDRLIGTGTTWTIWSLAPPPLIANMPPSDVQFYVGLDGLNVALVLLTSLMFFLAILVSWDSVTERAAGYYAWLFALQTGMIGTFLSFDIILFYIFFELTLIPAFFLIGRWGVGSGRRDAARKFLLYTLFGSLLTLVGIIGVVLANPTPVSPFGDPTTAAPYYAAAAVDRSSGEIRPPIRGPMTFAIPKLISNHSTWSVTATAWVEYREAALRQPNLSPTQRQAAEQALADARAEKDRFRTTHLWLFFALMSGFAVKIPLVPFHTWLPAAYAEAPLAVTMLLSALLAKLGAFGIVRLVLSITPEASIEYGLPVVGVLAAVGIVYAAFCAYAQRDLKMLVAYSSISHLGFLVLGLFALTPEGVTGAVLHMVNHGLTVGALFAMLGFLADRYRTLDIDQFGGLWAKFPRYTFFLFVIALASIGLPGLNNFISEMLMLAGLFDPRNTQYAGYGFGAVAAFGIFLSAWYMLSMIRRVFFGPVREPMTAGFAGSTATADGLAADVSSREFTTFAVLAACCLAIGLMPQPMLDIIRSDAKRLSDLGDSARYSIDPAMAFRTLPPPDEPPPVIRRTGPALGPNPDGNPTRPAGRPAGAPTGPPGVPRGNDPIKN